MMFDLAHQFTFFRPHPTSYIPANLIQKFNLIWPMKPLYLSFISVTSLKKIRYVQNETYSWSINSLGYFFFLFSSKFGLHSASNFHIPREKWLSWYRKKHIKNTDCSKNRAMHMVSAIFCYHIIIMGTNVASVQKG